jgi:hypothetical protein
LTFEIPGERCWEAVFFARVLGEIAGRKLWKKRRR